MLVVAVGSVVGNCSASTDRPMASATRLTAAWQVVFSSALGSIASCCVLAVAELLYSVQRARQGRGATAWRNRLVANADPDLQPLQRGGSAVKEPWGRLGLRTGRVVSAMYVGGSEGAGPPPPGRVMEDPGGRRGDRI